MALPDGGPPETNPDLDRTYEVLIEAIENHLDSEEADGDDDPTETEE